MKIKICCVDEDGRYGGPQSRMIDIYKNIDLKKYDYDFLIPSSVKIFKKKLTKIDANFYRLNITRLSSNFFILLKYILFLPLEIFILVNFFKKKKYDIIQVNGVPHFKSVIAAKLSNTKLIWIIEDSYSPKVILFIFKLFVKLFNPKIIYLSNSVYQFYLKDLNIDKKNLFKIMSPTNSKYFQRKKFRNQKIINVCSVSGIIKIKDTETYLKVAIDVLKKHENIRFFFAGRGTKSEIGYYKKIMAIYNSLDPKIKKKITFLGMSSNIKNLLEKSDIFLFTSKSEGGPIAIWEAMSMKLPVVTTKIGGTPEYIENGYSGYLCKVGDYKQLSNRISNLSRNKDLRKKFGIRSRIVVERLLDCKIISKKYQKVYESVHRKL